MDWNPPVSNLLTLGESVARQNPWPDYVKTYGFSAEHLPELVALMRDESMLEFDSDDPRVFANLHAWRVLGQLGAIEAVEPMLDQLEYEGEKDEFDFWGLEELPEAILMMGPAVLPQVGAMRWRVATCQNN